MAEWLARPSGNPEVPGSSLAVITLRINVLGRVEFTSSPRV